MYASYINHEYLAFCNTFIAMLLNALKITHKNHASTQSKIGSEYPLHFIYLLQDEDHHPENSWRWPKCPLPAESLDPVLLSVGSFLLMTNL
jgi:hypothetical protein